MRFQKILLSIFFIFLCAIFKSTLAVEMISNFNGTGHNLPPSWKIIRLEKHVPETQYSQIVWDGIPAVEAKADSSMALLGRFVEIDLNQTPILCWQWRIDHVIKTAEMSKRQGDDYAARIYLAFSLPSAALSLADKAELAVARQFFGQPIPDGAINYVWDNKYPIGTTASNAYTSRAKMVVQRSGNADAGKWVNERVNVLEDLGRFFGTKKGRVELLALAADTDNTNEKARAGFANIGFTRLDETCPLTAAEP